jgi:spore coat protein U-like protein
MKMSVASLLLLAVGLGGPAIAEAGQQCQVQAQPLQFGDYEAGTPVPLDSAGIVTVRCAGQPAGPFVVKLGSGTSGDPGQRTMQAGAETLSYNLFVDASRTRVWGDGTRGSEAVVVESEGGPRGRPRETELPVFGRIPAGQDPVPGIYADTVIVTVEF